MPDDMEIDTLNELPVQVNTTVGYTINGSAKREAERIGNTIQSDSNTVASSSLKNFKIRHEKSDEMNDDDDDTGAAPAAAATAASEDGETNDAYDEPDDDDDDDNDDIASDDIHVKGCGIELSKVMVDPTIVVNEVKSPLGNTRTKRSSNTENDPRRNLARSASGISAVRSIEGWIILVTNVHPEASEEDVSDLFADYGNIRNLHMNLDRRTGYVKGYALIEYAKLNEAKAAIKQANGIKLLDQTLTVDFAFVVSPKNTNSDRPTHHRRSRSPSYER